MKVLGVGLRSGKILEKLTYKKTEKGRSDRKREIADNLFPILSCSVFSWWCVCSCVLQARDRSVRAASDAFV